MSGNIPLWWLIVVVIAFAFMTLLFIVYSRKNKLQVTSKEEPPEIKSKVESVQTDKQVVREVNIPTALARLKLNNIRSFSTLDLGFSAIDSGIGQWTVILGDNGVGKSTILRSLVLALAEPDIATAVLQTQRSFAPFIRRAHDMGTIELTINGKLQYEVQLQRSARSVSEKLEFKKAAEDRPALLAYGPLRGSALGGAARRVSFSPIEQVATLFDESAQLIHAETWLGQTQLAALQTRGGADEAFFDSIIKTLVTLLPGVDSIQVSATGVQLSGPDVGKDVPLAAMSDGYVGTLGWVLDFMARWCYRYQQLTGKPPDGEITKEMSGLVVVDEIGLHLHPRWQTTVVQELRTQFPKMSFIVTSHHPLMLLGARKGEIHVLRRHPDTREVTIEQANIPPGTTADQILTGRWFNLSSTLDEDTKHLLEEHRSLLRAGKSEEDSRVQQLENDLRGRLGTFADTSIDRMALSVAADLIKEKESSFDKLSVDEKERIRKEMENELRSRMERMS